MTDFLANILAIIDNQFGAIVQDVEVISWSQKGIRSIRISLVDDSFLDVRITRRGNYSYHWQHHTADQSIHRWDNTPHHSNIATYPHHFHDGREENVVASALPYENHYAAIEFVLDFIARKIRSDAQQS